MVRVAERGPQCGPSVGSTNTLPGPNSRSAPPPPPRPRLCQDVLRNSHGPLPVSLDTYLTGLRWEEQRMKQGAVCGGVAGRGGASAAGHPHTVAMLMTLACVFVSGG